MPRTALVSTPFALPEPCVAVAVAPPTEMCGSDPRLCSAKPRSSSQRASSPYRVPAATVTVDASVSSANPPDSPARSMSVPAVSGRSVKEWRVPSACTLPPAAIACRTSSTVEAVMIRGAAYSCVPAQFCVIRPPYARAATAAET